MENNKLSVVTRSRDISRKALQIKTCLEGYPQGLNPKAIALKTGLNVNTVKSVLPRMKEVSKIIRGLYKVAKGGDSTQLDVSLFDWNFHNLILTAPLGVALCRRYSFGLITIDVVSTVERATFRLSCDFPLNVSSICMVAGWVQSFVRLMKCEPVEFSDIMVSTIEFNRDFKNIRLDGAQSVSIDNLVEQFKVYQKSVGLRVEHKTKVPMRVDSIVSMLTNNPNSVEFHVKLNEQSVALDRLIKATRVNTDLVLKLMEGG